MFETGRIGMYEVANWYLSEARDKFAGNWGIAPIPLAPAERIRCTGELCDLQSDRAS